MYKLCMYVHTYVRTYAELEKTIGHFPTSFTILAKLVGQIFCNGEAIDSL